MRKIKSTPKPQIADTKKRILNESIRLFLEKGYHGTSIDDITQAAGLTKGAFYWHFRSKEDLLKSIIEEFEKHFLGGLINAAGQAKGMAVDKFEKMVRYISGFAYYNRELCLSFTTLAAEIVGTHQDIEAHIRRIYKKYQEFVSKIIVQGKKEKIFRRELDVNLTALVIMAFADGLLLQWSMNRDSVDGKAYVKSLKKIMLYGLLARPQST